MVRSADLRWIAGLAGLAAAVRAVAWARAAVMFNDGPLFLTLARLFARGDAAEALAHPQHPLYPLAVAGAHVLLPGLPWDDAGAAVSVAAGAAATVFLFLLLRDLFGRSCALWGSGVFALHPAAVAFSSDVQSDALHLACFLAAAWGLWRALERQSLPAAMGAGLASGAAFLTRPEGAFVALVGAAALLALGAVGRLPRRRATALAVAVAGGALLVAAPYLLELREQTGSFTLTRKKSALAVAGLASGPAGPVAAASRAPAAPSELLSREPHHVTALTGPIGGVGRERETGPWVAAGELLDAIAGAARLEFLPLLVAGLLALPRDRRREGFLALLVVPWIGMLAGLALHAGYVDKRHALPAVVLLFGYVGAGATLGGGWLARRVSQPRPVWAAAAAGLLVAALAFPNLAPSRRGDRLAERRAAEWLRAQLPAPAPVAAGKQRIAWYAGAPHVALPEAGSGDLVDYLRRSGARHLIVRGERPDVDAGLRAGGLVRVHESVERGARASVFAVVGG